MTECLVLPGNSAGKQDHLYEFAGPLVRSWFGPGRYGRMGTIGDGSCFFHSLCLALDIQDYVSKATPERKTVAHGLRCKLSKNFTEADFNAIVETMRTKPSATYLDVKRQLCEPATWAEEVMIKWTSKALDTNIVFLNLSNEANTLYCGVHDAATAEAVKRDQRPEWPTVVVAWIDHAHFELVVRIDSVGSEDVTIRRVFDPLVAEDLQTIEHLKKAYMAKCHI
jgi:hypothetical protein